MIGGLYSTDRAWLAALRKEQFGRPPKNRTCTLALVKSVFFIALGFSSEQWLLLRDALLDQARKGDAAAGQPSPFGLKFEIRATLTRPLGRQASVVTVWMVSSGQDFPHFVTADPG